MHVLGVHHPFFCWNHFSVFRSSTPPPKGHPCARNHFYVCHGLCGGHVGLRTGPGIQRAPSPAPEHEPTRDSTHFLQCVSPACSFRRGSRILVREGPVKFGPQGGALNPNWLKIGLFPLKLPENCMILKKSWGQGGPGILDPLLSFLKQTHDEYAYRIPNPLCNLSTPRWR